VEREHGGEQEQGGDFFHGGFEALVGRRLAASRSHATEIFRGADCPQSAAAAPARAGLKLLASFLVFPRAASWDNSRSIQISIRNLIETLPRLPPSRRCGII